MNLAARIGTMARRGEPLPYDYELDYVTVETGTKVPVISEILGNPDIEVDVWGSDYDISGNNPYQVFVSTTTGSPFSRGIGLAYTSGEKRLYYGGPPNTLGNYVVIDGYSSRHRFKSKYNKDTNSVDLFVDGNLTAEGTKTVSSIKILNIGTPGNKIFMKVPFKFYRCEITMESGEVLFIIPVAKDEVPYLYYSGDNQLKTPSSGSITAGPIKVASLSSSKGGVLNA